MPTRKVTCEMSIVGRILILVIFRSEFSLLPRVFQGRTKTHNSECQTLADPSFLNPALTFYHVMVFTVSNTSDVSIFRRR